MATCCQRFFLLTVTLCLFNSFSSFVRAQSPAPFEATWSSSTFGPDGPWQAVEVIVGEDSKVALYPGHTFQSLIIATDYCKLNSSNGCYASKAGTYNPAQALRDGTGSASGIQYRPPLYEWMAGMDVRGQLLTSWVDSMVLKSASTAGPIHRVENVSLTLVQNQMIAYPGGTWYPAFAGCLGVGAANTINQSFTTPSYLINASLVPGTLWMKSQITSNSFSMHIGSVASRMAGSLWFGGFDKNRLVGDVLVADEDFVRSPVTLKDISIDVIQGASPFNFTAQGGLLALGNSSIGNGLRVAVDGCAPYLTLPKSTCDNIASHLPVNYNADLGLYFWDTESPKYSQIVTSASTLSFTFLSESNTKTTTIRVPFFHLNLTLSEPLVDSPTPYFPCFTGGPGTYNLGRAFLQDAFIGANWGQSKWWLGQAPGPNIQLSPSVVDIAEEDSIISGGKNDWEESWKGVWKALTEDQANGTTPVEPPVQTTSGSPSGVSSDETQATPGLSTAAKAGIGAGAAALLLVAIGTAILYWRRRRSQQREGSVRHSVPPQYQDIGGRFHSQVLAEPYKAPVEVYGSFPVQIQEVPAGNERARTNKTSNARVELP
ncbi:Eukaryotic aspartyl protease [Colletotrichum higginsianum IMI 349063]|uniref:Eukaryotic aspartyl protease n=1 Tax=Colletotrichum higginsianum (strain IMI 349063) TaxID=759273 RepID=A0A1B7YFE3_COLHI|nr:Eukaryotic aspartyl protease [Colletotrichum higginsianum IMI 349063]OBR10756.1 Eukaryotic aspartyl protease [Colletotrichum higginsianum IMI 349063]